MICRLLGPVLLLLTLLPLPARADEATDKARSHYEMGIKLFDAGQNEQALVEFKEAYDTKPRPGALFMMAQCEYTLGLLREARAHYEQYERENPNGEFVDLARYRIQAIDKRPSVFAINAVPDSVNVRIVSDADKPRTVATGEAPNNFSVPRGRYRIVLSKPGYIDQVSVVEVGIAETKPLFFKLDPIPARLEIETSPPGATLYVNGNRARNPYAQNVPPGRYEVIAEAPDHDDRAFDFTLRPGERRLYMGSQRLALKYLQRSGRPELWVASGVMGGVVGGAAVAASIGPLLDGSDSTVSTATFIVGGSVAGVITGMLAASAFVPKYIPDNRALYIMGGMWIGALQGASIGTVVEQAQRANDETADQQATVTVDGVDRVIPASPAYAHRPGISQQLRAAFLGGLPGLAVGTTVSALFSRKAPTYGRVALIQSAAAGGALGGWLAGQALKWRPFDWDTWTGNWDANGQPIGWHVEDAPMRVLDGSLATLIGLNVGLTAGLLGAYLPDQSRYGPSWQRIALIDLAVVAGILAGGIGGCIADPNCVSQMSADSQARAGASALAFGGGLLGLATGIYVTRNLDATLTTASKTPPVHAMLAPISGANGSLLPSLTLFGTF